MKSLIIGAGQIGQALFEIFSPHHDCSMRDILAPEDNPKGVEVLHIAYPYGDYFLKATRDYVEEYKPVLTIIHSTVAVGTTRTLGKGYVHSPERGRFPHLAEQMLAYTKFVAGNTTEDVALACQYFRKCCWATRVIHDPSTTEKLKLVSNVHMGLEIAWRQELERLGLDAEAYRLWEDSYFGGYVQFGEWNLVRSRMNPEPIGGHCILPSVDILSETFQSPFCELIKETNAHAMAKREIEKTAAA